MKKFITLTLCTLFIVGSQQFMQAMEGEVHEAPVVDPKAQAEAQNQHDQAIAQHKAIMDNSKSTPQQISDSMQNVGESHTEVMKANSGGGFSFNMADQKTVITDPTGKTFTQSVKHYGEGGRPEQIETTFDTATGKMTSSKTTNVNTGEVTSTTKVTTDSSGIKTTVTIDLTTGNKVTTKNNPKTGTQIVTTVDGKTGNSVAEQTNPKTGDRATTTVIKDKVNGNMETTVFVDGKTGKEVTDTLNSKTGETTRLELTKEQVQARDRKAKVAETVTALQDEASNANTPVKAKVVIEKAVDSIAPTGTDPQVIADVKVEANKEAQAQDITKPGILQSLCDAISRIFGKKNSAPINTSEPIKSTPSVKPVTAPSGGFDLFTSQSSAIAA